ncbi:hypothetical protein QBC43DRAFT_353314 [Cladorrhinum sp. PSN259]|nr:hypothetical protein QBC43DRAFT_353314 [Cladorrhinum sp. PSN259]
MLLLRANDYDNALKDEPTIVDQLLGIGPRGGSDQGQQIPPEVGTTILPSTTLDMEEGNPATASWPSDSDATHHPRDILGKKILSQREKWIDIVTIFSAVVATLKLFFSTLPWSIRTPALILFSGWMAVQFLLYLFHREELEDRNITPILDEAKIRWNHKNTRFILALVDISAIVLLVMWISGKSGNLFVDEEDIYFKLPRTWQSHLWLPFWIFTVTFGASIIIQTPSLIIILILVLIILVSAFYPGCLVVVSWYFKGISLILVYWIFQLPTREEGFLAYRGKGRIDFAEPAHWALYANVLMNLYFFALLLQSYDPTGTNKPAWLEYFG